MSLSLSLSVSLSALNLPNQAPPDLSPDNYNRRVEQPFGVYCPVLEIIARSVTESDGDDDGVRPGVSSDLG
jgi:hypothetical protein